MSPTHPDQEVLLRFAQGGASRAEGRAVVAHLLHGCERCAAVVQEAAFPRRRDQRRPPLKPQSQGRRAVCGSAAPQRESRRESPSWQLLDGESRRAKEGKG